MGRKGRVWMRGGGVWGGGRRRGEEGDEEGRGREMMTRVRRKIMRGE